MPFFPAEGEQQRHAPRDIEKKEIEDEVGGDADEQRNECVSDVVEEKSNKAGDEECSERGVNREEYVLCHGVR